MLSNRELAETFICPTCSAAPGDSCKREEVHLSRRALAQRQTDHELLTGYLNQHLVFAPSGWISCVDLRNDLNRWLGEQRQHIWSARKLSSRLAEIYTGPMRKTTVRGTDGWPVRAWVGVSFRE